MRSRDIKIANNTRLIIDQHGESVKLHDTIVVYTSPDGYITLDSGGWQTVTTKDRMNKELQPYNCYIQQRKGKWYLRTPQGEQEYEDGMTFHPGQPAQEPNLNNFTGPKNLPEPLSIYWTAMDAYSTRR